MARNVSATVHPLIGIIETIDSNWLAGGLPKPASAIGDAKVTFLVVSIFIAIAR